MATFSLMFYTYMHFKNKFKVYLKHTSANYFLNYFSIIFIKLETLGVTVSKSTLKVYFIVRVYSEVYLNYSSILTRQNTCRSIHNLWSNGFVIRGQVYQTRFPRFFWKWLKNCISLLSFEAQSNDYQGFLRTWLEYIH